VKKRVRSSAAVGQRLIGAFVDRWHEVRGITDQRDAGPQIPPHVGRCRFNCPGRHGVIADPDEFGEARMLIRE
jgi:hypothetical protein